jgi:hypothetical protein
MLLLCGAVFRIRIRNPVLFDTQIRDGEKSRSNIRDEHSGSYCENLVSVNLVKKILKLFYADPDPGYCQPWIRDGKNRILDKTSQIRNTAVEEPVIIFIRNVRVLLEVEWRQ